MRTIIETLFAGLVISTVVLTATHPGSQEQIVLHLTREALAICRAETCEARVFQRLLQIEDVLAPRPKGPRG